MSLGSGTLTWHCAERVVSNLICQALRGDELTVYGDGSQTRSFCYVSDLVAGLIAHGHRHARAILDENDLERLVREQARPGDMVVCLGAGTISTWANGLPERLQGRAA